MSIQSRLDKLGITLPEAAGKNISGQRIAQLLLDGALQGSRTVASVVPAIGERVHHFLRPGEAHIPAL